MEQLPESIDYDELREAKSIQDLIEFQIKNFGYKINDLDEQMRPKDMSDYSHLLNRDRVKDC